MRNPHSLLKKSRQRRAQALSERERELENLKDRRRFMTTSSSSSKDDAETKEADPERDVTETPRSPSAADANDDSRRVTSEYVSGVQQPRSLAEAIRMQSKTSHSREGFLPIAMPRPDPPEHLNTPFDYEAVFQAPNHIEVPPDYSRDEDAKTEVSELTHLSEHNQNLNTNGASFAERRSATRYNGPISHLKQQRREQSNKKKQDPVSRSKIPVSPPGRLESVAEDQISQYRFFDDITESTRHHPGLMEDHAGEVNGNARNGLPYESTDYNPSTEESEDTWDRKIVVSRFHAANRDDASNGLDPTDGEDTAVVGPPTPRSRGNDHLSTLIRETLSAEGAVIIDTTDIKDEDIDALMVEKKTSPRADDSPKDEKPDESKTMVEAVKQNGAEEVEQVEAPKEHVEEKEVEATEEETQFKESEEKNVVSSENPDKRSGPPRASSFLQLMGLSKKKVGQQEDETKSGEEDTGPVLIAGCLSLARDNVNIVCGDRVDKSDEVSLITTAALIGTGNKENDAIVRTNRNVSTSVEEQKEEVAEWDVFKLLDDATEASAHVRADGPSPDVVDDQKDTNPTDATADVAEDQKDTTTETTDEVANDVHEDREEQPETTTTRAIEPSVQSDNAQIENTLPEVGGSEKENAQPINGDNEGFNFHLPMGTCIGMSLPTELTKAATNASTSNNARGEGSENSEESFFKTSLGYLKSVANDINTGLKKLPKMVSISENDMEGMLGVLGKDLKETSDKVPEQRNELAEFVGEQLEKASCNVDHTAPCGRGPQETPVTAPVDQLAVTVQKTYGVHLAAETVAVNPVKEVVLATPETLLAPTNDEDVRQPFGQSRLVGDEETESFNSIVETSPE